MKQSKLFGMTRDALKEIFEYHDGNIYWKVDRPPNIKAGDEAGCYDKYSSGRSRIKLNGKKRLRSRLVFMLHNDYLPEFIDHINGNGIDDRIENLRPATRAENNQNVKKRKACSSQYKGVSKRGNKWIAQIQYNKIKIHLGTFKIENEAAIAFNRAAIKYFGTFAKLNMIGE